jgi:hypothetical protein
MQQLLTTFGETRRSRRRQALLGTARLVGVALAIAGGALASYQIGRSQSGIERARFESDLSALQELNRLLSERAASAEQRAEAAITRAAKLQRSYDADVPQGQTRELLDLLQQRLKDGMPAARLEFLLREARVERKCDPPSETKRLLVHTSVTPTPAATAGFAKNQITVSVEGAPQRKPDGRTDPIFDPQQPVTLHLLRIGRDVAKAEGRLPLSHSLVLGDREFRFTVKAADKGQAELIAQVCDFP